MQDREQICTFYICMGKCKKGREANHWHYCQHCDKYKPRSKEKVVNKKKEKFWKINKKDDWD